MEFKFLKKYYTGYGNDDYQDIHLINFKSKYFKFRWFTDCDY